MATMFFGQVSAPGASGEFNIALPTSPEGWVTGSVRIGNDPEALTGFTGKMTGARTFRARGENLRGRGLAAIYLLVDIEGELSPDGQHVTGKIHAIVGDAPQQPWTFSAAIRGADPLEAPKGEPGELELISGDDDAMPDIPTPLKWVAGVGAAIAAALFLKKRFM